MSTVKTFFKNIFKRKPNKLTGSVERYQDFSYSLNGYSTNSLNNPLSAAEFLMYGLCVRAVQLIANDIGKVNFRHLKILSNGERVPIANSQLSKLLNTSPNQTQTPWAFKKTLIWNLMLHGKAPILVVREPESNSIAELFPIFPNYVEKEENENGVQYWWVKGDKPLRLYDDEIIWIDYELIPGFESLNIRTLFKSTIAKLKENEISLARAVTYDLRHNLLVKIRDATNREQREEAENAIRAMIQRQKQTGSLGMVVDQKWDVGKIGDLVNMQIDHQTRNSIGREFAASLGIPPAKLGIDDPNKYNSSVELNRAYVDNSLKPLLINITQEMTKAIGGRDEEITYRPIDLLSIDAKSIQEFASSGINNGFITPNEIRELLGFDKHPDGDSLLANGTLTPVNLLQNPNFDVPKEKGKEDT
ncbi:phage portal protein [Mycoplasma miroungigenitalium]|uniref:Phage portal protein n=1 Tax=Mycoplasma miroungigenitalium TaxID=754515 RepID=A0A6M4JC26_9MOLU|nr:phage portal protein [Mycoplasma miroungigenitalium]QJR43629.1 phage portal protein [Mycoplasma miroungigenitalium]